MDGAERGIRPAWIPNPLRKTSCIPPVQEARIGLTNGPAFSPRTRRLRCGTVREPDTGLLHGRDARRLAERVRDPCRPDPSLGAVHSYLEENAVGLLRRRPGNGGGIERDLAAVMSLVASNLRVGLEVEDRPRVLLLERQIEDALDELAVSVQPGHRRFPPALSSGPRGVRPPEQRMREYAFDDAPGDGDFGVGGPDDPAVRDGRRGDLLGRCVQRNGGQNGVDKGPEPAAAGFDDPEVRVENLDRGRGFIQIRRPLTGRPGDGLDHDTGPPPPRADAVAFLPPLFVRPQARRDGFAAGVGDEVLTANTRGRRGIEAQRMGIPPDDAVAGLRGLAERVEARSDGTRSRGLARWTVHDAIVAERRAAGRRG